MIQEALLHLNQKQKDESNTEPISVQDVSFTVEISDAQSVGGKRKRNKLHHGSTQNDKKRNGSISPIDTVAIVEFTNGTKMEVKSCVLGSVMEVNKNLQENPSLLVTDPLLDGYIAVVMPSGLYPPKELLKDVDDA